MKAERGIGRHRVGAWHFTPATGELRRRTDIRRLEPRAAKVLEMLCEAGGEVVSQEQLIVGVWNGRSLSDNSVAVVIGQLRRALDDKAREPRTIETIPKRGYRLVVEQSAMGINVGRPPRTLIIGAVAATALLVAVGADVVSSRSKPSAAVIGVTPVANQTGSAKYEPLARATDEVILSALTRRGFEVRGAPLLGGLTLQPKLVLWNGEPSVGLTAVGPDHVVRWSRTTTGGAAKIPSEIGRNVDELASAVDRRLLLPTRVAQAPGHP